MMATLSTDEETEIVLECLQQRFAIWRLNLVIFLEAIPASHKNCNFA